MVAQILINRGVTKWRRPGNFFIRILISFYRRLK